LCSGGFFLCAFIGIYEPLLSSMFHYSVLWTVLFVYEPSFESMFRHTGLCSLIESYAPLSISMDLQSKSMCHPPNSMLRPNILWTLTPIQCSSTQSPISPHQPFLRISRE